jgi:hypothetical protein
LGVQNHHALSIIATEGSASWRATAALLLNLLLLATCEPVTSEGGAASRVDVAAAVDSANQQAKRDEEDAELQKFLREIDVTAKLHASAKAEAAADLAAHQVMLLKQKGDAEKIAKGRAETECNAQLADEIAVAAHQVIISRFRRGAEERAKAEIEAEIAANTAVAVQQAKFAKIKHDTEENAKALETHHARSVELEREKEERIEAGAKSEAQALQDIEAHNTLVAYYEFEASERAAAIADFVAHEAKMAETFPVKL